MHKWWDNLTLGEKMGYWNAYKAEGEPDSVILEKAYKDYLKNFKLKVV